MQLVRLAGELGEKYGYEHEYCNLRTPADAIKLLCFNYPQLQKDLVEAHHNGIGYKVIQGGAAMGYDELHLPFGSRPLLVVPVISGSGGRGAVPILIGAALVATAIVTGGTSIAFGATGFGLASGVTATTALGLSVAAGNLGLALAVGGIATLVSPQPEVPRLGSRRLEGGTNVRGTGPTGNTRGASGQQSYAFNGPVNTVGTGATIPVIYGRVITGGHLLSLDIDISDESDPLKKTLGVFTRDLVKINGELISTDFIEENDVKTRVIEDFVPFVDKKKQRNRINHIFGPGINSALDKDQDLKVEDDGLEYKKDGRKKVDVIFKVETKFFDHVADETSAKIDGFIEYNIVLRLGGEQNAVVARLGATLQGKFKASEDDPFVYGHRLEVPKSDKAEDIKIELEIVDASVADEVKFTLYGIGYDEL